VKLLDSAVTHFRSTFCVLLLIVVAGIVARANMTIEASPNPSIPIAVVTVFQEGISPEDGARLLIRPLEKELRALEGVEEITATARESSVYLVVKFEAEQNLDQAIIDVRTAVDRARAELPLDAEEPEVKEVSAQDFPSIILTISGDVQERVLFNTAKRLQAQIETLPSVLAADLTGQREEVVEAIVDPAKLEHYQITSTDLGRAIASNNLLIPAGKLDTGAGRFAVKVPSLIETREDVYQLPLKWTASGVVTLSDVADIRRTFKDASQYTSANGKHAIAIEVKKRIEANDIEVTQAVRDIAKSLSAEIPQGVEIDYLMDQSEFALGMVTEMQGNILTAMILVMVVIIAALGVRSGILVGLGVPFSLLSAAIILLYIGFSFNFMVLFGMLLALGMLIDGAIVVTEFADRKMAEGMSSKVAYSLSVKRMYWPVVASTATTLAAFLPIMFWPGVAGEFMRYLPVTVFAVLAGSLFYALLFAPAIGSVLGKSKIDSRTTAYLQNLETGASTALPGITGRYARLLQKLVGYPREMLFLALTVLVASFTLFVNFNNGVEFFVKTEQKYGTASVRAQGNLSVLEAQLLVAQVEEKILATPGVKVLYSVASPGAPQQFGSRPPEKDQIGSMLIELYDPEELGRSTFDVYADIRDKIKTLPGIYATANAMEDGPPVGKPVQLQLTSADSDKLLRTTRDLRQRLETDIVGLRDVTDTSPLPGIEWQLQVDRALAAQLGADVVEVGRAVQLVTNGIKVGEYRPDDADDEVDIRIRYPFSERSIQALDQLKVNTSQGSVPLSSFVTRVARPMVDKVQRLDGREYMLVMADVEEGVLADDMVEKVKIWLVENPIDAAVEVNFRGANEEQEKSQAFLGSAFSLALFLMFILLVTQFNSFYQALLTLSAVIMATAGVMLGLWLTQSSFSTIMTGVGIVALAGIVVNNNIVLIDTYNHLRKVHPHMSAGDAAIMSGAQRLRPVFLTTATTILGLLPLALGLSIDIIDRNMVYGGVVGSYWKSLASAIVYGLVFSTVLTLLLTPVMLVLQDVCMGYIRPLKQRLKWCGLPVESKLQGLKLVALFNILLLGWAHLYHGLPVSNLLLPSILCLYLGIGLINRIYATWLLQISLLYIYLLAALFIFVDSYFQFDLSMLSAQSLLINSVVIVSSLFALNYLNGAAVRRFFDINIQQ
jgi:multidrug efflux pump